VRGEVDRILAAVRRHAACDRCGSTEGVRSKLVWVGPAFVFLLLCPGCREATVAL
jgi:hypothetical protein